MHPTNNISEIEETYNHIAPYYDSNKPEFEERRYADFTKWMNLSPGLSVLDLACGTGEITIAAKIAVGPSGKVVGVDVSSGSLKVAQEKADEDDAFNHIARTALPNAVKSWKSFFKPNSRIAFEAIYDPWTPQRVILDSISHKLHVPMPTRISYPFHESLEAIQAVLEDAGLNASESFKTENAEARGLIEGHEKDAFDELIKHVDEGNVCFEDLAVRRRARRKFCSKMKKIAEEEEGGTVLYFSGFFVAVGTLLPDSSLSVAGEEEN